MHRCQQDGCICETIASIGRTERNSTTQWYLKGIENRSAQYFQRARWGITVGHDAVNGNESESYQRVQNENAQHEAGR
jgi:hypothetical protein